ncbi:MAG: rod shape-determining protein RodA [Elusimicrobia bacterium]|nr:rod shape-determining protein RodA [Elusimicrobiota bacterium]
MLIRAETGVKGKIDWAFFAAALGLLAMGTLSVFSAANELPYYGQVIQKHLSALALGGLLFLFGLTFNYQIFQDQAKVLYGVIIAVLVAVLLVGVTQRGQKAWFNLGFMTFQPAELARASTILVLAAFLDFRARKTHEFATVLMTVGVAAPVMMLILKQPDFSTTLVFFPVLLGMLFCAGASIAHLLAVTGFGFMALSMPLFYTLCQVRYAEAGPGSWAYWILQTSRFGAATWIVVGSIIAASVLAWRLAAMARFHVRAVFFVVAPLILISGFFSGIMVHRQLKGYQRNRFVAFLAPETDIQGAAYNVRQSQIAIGSGGVVGKGLFSGTQSRLGFLPERHTDFVYAVVGEELGFFGTMAILSLYLALIWRIVIAGRLARDRFGFLICCGMATMYSFHLVLNVGMCLGLMPVAGIPLPLISYGGSSLVITLWTLGVVANVYSRRYSLL